MLEETESDLTEDEVGQQQLVNDLKKIEAETDAELDQRLEALQGGNPLKAFNLPTDPHIQAKTEVPLVDGNKDFKVLPFKSKLDPSKP